MVTVCPSQFATRRTLFHVLVGCGLLMLKVSRLKLPVIWLDRKSGSAGMPRPISYAVFCLKKKNYLALQSNVAGSRGTAFGTSAMVFANNSTTPFENTHVAIGFDALRGSTDPSAKSGLANTAIGYQSLLSFFFNASATTEIYTLSLHDALPIC